MKRMNETQNGVFSGTSAKRPIKRSFIIAATVFFTVLCAVVIGLSYRIFSVSLYGQYDSKMNEIITYVENNIDADDLKNCIDTGRHSEKYDGLQAFLNGMVDDLGLEYLYIVIPEKTVMVNVISATNAAEREAGEDDMALLEETDAYSEEELARYAAFFAMDGINCFEETSDYGSFYTGCKALKDSSGNRVALICVDLSISELYDDLGQYLGYSIAALTAVFAIFAVIVVIWMSHTVTNPLLLLERSANAFAVRSHAAKSISELRYDAPEIRTENEVRSLAEAIKKMAEDMRLYVEETAESERRAHMAETENIRLSEEAAAEAKITKFSQLIDMLLENMPAMSFYKDAENGTYLGCNKLFAEFACKNDPAEVTGKNAVELFGEKTAKQFSDEDKALYENNGPHLFFDDVCDPRGNQRQFQTTKLSFTDTNGRKCVLGMCVEVTEMVAIRREKDIANEAYKEAVTESVTYSRIARALSTDYAYIFYVNINTEDFIEYRTAVSSEELSFERRGRNFFEESRTDAQALLHKEDRRAFINVFTKENVLEKIEDTGAFTLTYRLLEEGKTSYVHMKASRLKDDPDHIIIGVSNIDAQMKYQEAYERVQEERTTYARIMALSGDFICIYTVDPEIGRYTEYVATRSYEGLGLDKEGEDFFRKAREESRRVLYYEDLDMFLSMMTKENVMNEVKQNGFFVIDYRLMINGTPKYVMLKAAVVEEKDGPQLVIGISNIDAQVKREQEYAKNLSIARSEANIDALTGVKNKHAYIDVEARLNNLIDEKKTVSFALAVFDMNGLKLVNDTLGHRAGDEYIRSACGMICDHFKHSPVFRIGGDEFVAVAQGQDYDNIETIISDFRENNIKNAGEGKIVVACGAAVYNGDRSVSAVFERADREMYNNKRELKEIG